MITTFENPSNGYQEEVDGTSAAIFTLLFGCFYFAFKGVWPHAVISFALALISFGISWLVYPFFAPDILRTHYRKQGWREVTEEVETPDAADSPYYSPKALSPTDKMGIALAILLGLVVMLGMNW